MEPTTNDNLEPNYQLQFDAIRRYHNSLEKLLRNNAEWWSQAQGWLSFSYGKIITESLTKALDVIEYFSSNKTDQYFFEVIKAFGITVKRVVEITNEAEQNLRNVRIIDIARNNNDAIRTLAERAVSDLDLDESSGSSSSSRSSSIESNPKENIASKSEFKTSSDNKTKEADSSGSSFEKITLNSKERIKEIQNALKQIGLFKSTVDGIYGRLTQVAVRGFQTEYDLPVTGDVDEKTYAEILRIASAKKDTGQNENPVKNKRPASSAPTSSTKDEFNIPRSSNPIVKNDSPLDSGRIANVWWFRVGSLDESPVHSMKVGDVFEFHIGDVDESLEKHFLNINSSTRFVLYGDKEKYIEAIFTPSFDDYYPLGAIPTFLTFKLEQIITEWLPIIYLAERTKFDKLTPLQPEKFNKYKPTDAGYTFQPFTEEEEEIVLPVILKEAELHNQHDSSVLNNPSLADEITNPVKEYEYIQTEYSENDPLKTNYLFVRIDFERFSYLIPTPDGGKEKIDFSGANWNGFIKEVFILPELITDDIKILPFIDTPVNNIPLLLKPEINNSKVIPKGGRKLIYEDIFKYQVTLDKLVEAIPSFKEKKLFQQDKIYEGITYLSKEEFDKIIQLGRKSFIGDRFNKSTLSEIFTDSASAEIKDQLGFESDVNALASVIAYKKVEPPLAIGLFGNWGSGKSFFMNKLEKKIKDFSELKNDIYCHEVVSVKFNSWHYSDSNLWASLITKIFEDLKKHGDRENKPLEQLYEHLNSIKEAKDDAQVLLNRIIAEKQVITNNLEKVKEVIEKETTNLKEVADRDILNAVWNDGNVQENVGRINNLLPTDLVENFADINTKIGELRSFSNQLIESIQIAYRFRKGKMLIALIVALIVAGVYYSLNADAGQPFSILQWKWLTSKTSIVLAAISQLILILGPFKKMVSTAYENLKSLEATCLKLEKEKKIEKSKELEVINNGLVAKKEEQQKQEEELYQLNKKEIDLENDIKDIVSGRKLHRFIEGRANDERYISNLGIISWIRKDFEELDFLLKLQYEITDEELKKLGKKKAEISFKVDRIVLYIDDLDRCNEDIVVRVLEAIHLLLAFPLFVVVVGVDPRWMHNALTLKYKKFLNGSSNGKQATLKSDTVNTHTNEENKYSHVTNPATSYDYLEKIFQVPFVLKPIEDSGKDKLIRSKFEIKKTDEIPDKKTNDANVNQKDLQNAQGAIVDNNAIAPDVNYKLNYNPAQNPSTVDLTSSNTKQVESPKADKVTDTAQPETFVDQSELLKVTEEEIKFMQDISFLIGETPRTINRYINIYRIIRTHSQFEFIDDKDLEHYYAALILLGVITGMPEAAKEFLNAISSGSDETTFGIFLQSYTQDIMTDKKYFDSFIDQMSKEETIKLSGTIALDKFKKNLELIKRFSFRNLS